MSFRSVVFAGGGSRCFWQSGFYTVVSERLGIAPRYVAGVSAGSAMACLAFSGQARAGLAHFLAATQANRSNFYPRRLLSRSESAFPHLKMYRNAIVTVLDDAAFARLMNGPRIHVLLARHPRWLKRRTPGAALAFAAYLLERHTVGPVHPTLNLRLGYQPEVATVQECRTVAEVADLILHSSCSPPITPHFDRGGAPVLDGGAIDPVPMMALPEDRGHTLVMLTSRYAPGRIPRSPDAVYVQPSQPIPVSKWDYASPRRIQEAFDLGRRDAEGLRLPERLTA